MYRQANSGGDEPRPFILIAVADYVEGNGSETPRLLELGMECAQYNNSLPVSGGVLDQPAGLISKLRQVMNVFHAVKMYSRDGKEPGAMAKWRSEHENLWNIVSEIDALREKYG